MLADQDTEPTGAEARMAEVVVVASIRARAGQEEAALAALAEAAARTHEEVGCLLYALHRSPDDPARIVIIEHWESRAALDDHLQKPYIRALGEQTQLLDGAPDVHFLEPVPEGDAGKGRLGAG